jgi:hypothetical protein
MEEKPEVVESGKNGTSFIPIEGVIVCGVLLVICGIIFVIYRLVTPGPSSETVIGKLLDQLNILEGAMISWGTTMLGAFARKIGARKGE